MLRNSNLTRSGAKTCAKEKLAFANKVAERARQTFVQVQQTQQRHVEHCQQVMQKIAEQELERQELWKERCQESHQRHLQVFEEHERRILTAYEQGNPLQEGPQKQADAASPQPVPSRRKPEQGFFELVALNSRSLQDSAGDRVRFQQHLHPGGFWNSLFLD